MGTPTKKRPFTLEVDDRMDKERAQNKGQEAKNCGAFASKNDMSPMDSEYQEDLEEITSDLKIKINRNFMKGVRGITGEAAQDKDKFDMRRLFSAVSSGEVAQLEGLEQYLRRAMKHLTDSEYQSKGKTALLKALLNLKEGRNDTVKLLLDIAEKMGDLEEFVNAAYTDMYYKGELPLSLAACTNQKDMVDFLLENQYQNADVREADSQGNIVLHALVMVADNSSENTDIIIKMYDHILTRAAQLHPKVKLEEIENKQGLTSIKLAAKKGKIEAVLFLVSVVLYFCSRREYLGCMVLCLALSWVNLLYYFRGSKNMARQNLTATALELFKFTIGMGDLEFTEQYRYKEVFYVLLISYIVLTYILLLNMLIALMSKTVQRTSEESANIWTLQRAITILDIERHLPWCLKCRLRSGVEKNLGTENVEERRWCFRKPHPRELNDYRPVALTSHVMKTMERLVLCILRPQVRHALDPLQFAYQEKVGVDDAITYLLHRTHSHLDKGKSAVGIMFFDFSSAFNTIQPLRLGDKLLQMGVDAHLVSWITDYLTD
ncbi:hypothetical protein AALO_G00021700 [Alosa alosa]|uniref:Reverse transcriptase domain-containing protein n=1 Tax=Alosa alosa TaxID=278164 RepID=A0AAV6HDQ2_9TELE|nr:hypothetical protein AALO_G00021700 [Alosa alosa]